MVRVWDLPTRLFHWALALAFAGDWLTRDATRLDVHEFLGYAIGGLVVFRLAWGWLGTRWARFSSFPLSARAAWRYVRGMLARRPEPHVGHNPAGSWAIYTLLAFAALQVLTGMVALGGEQRLGALAGMPSFALGNAAHVAHRILAYAMLAVVGVHIAGVVVGSLLERENLVRSMLTGLKHATAADGVAPRRGVAGFMIALLALTAFAWFAAGRSDARVQRSIAALALPRDPRWQSECGGCHLAYHPALLPARSWQKLFAGQHEHFGEDLDLSDAKSRQLEEYAVRNAADTLPSPLAWKIAHSVARDAAPLRVSETAYWRERHERVDPAVFKRVHASDCGACHRDADSASFSALAIHLPDGPAAPQEKK